MEKQASRYLCERIKNQKHLSMKLYLLLGNALANIVVDAHLISSLRTTIQMIISKTLAMNETSLLRRTKPR